VLDVENYRLKVGKLYKGKFADDRTMMEIPPTITFIQTKTGWERVYAGAVIMVLSATVCALIPGCTSMAVDHMVLYGDDIGRLRLATEDDFLSWSEVKSQ